MRVIVLKNHSYGGAKYKVGEAYEAQDKYAKVLILAKVVKPMSEEDFVTRAIDTIATALTDADEPRPKRRYRRRDLEAEA
jgi:hypothetical protein